MNKRILVTGSSGFIGKALVNRLSGVSYDVLGLDMTSGVDLTVPEEVLRIESDREIVIHLAAKSYVPDSFSDPYSFYFNNIHSTLNLLEYCRKNKARFIFFSSYLYGNPDYLPINENHPLRPHNPYAQTKYLCEELCKAYNRDFDVPIVIMRPFNIYGAGQNPNFLIPTILNQFNNNGSVTLKDPRPKRDFIHVDDVVSAVEKVMAKDVEGLNVFNLGFGKSFSIQQIIDTLQQLFNNRTKISFTNEFRKNEVMDTVADVQNLYTATGWKPQIDLETGLRKTIENSRIYG